MQSSENKRKRKFRRTKKALLALLALLVLPHIAHRQGALAPGLGVDSGPHALAPGQARVLLDLTQLDPARGERIIRQEIMDEILALVREAEQFVYMDVFLWNDWQSDAPERYRLLSSEIGDALIRKKRENPAITILVMTDPINRGYGTGVPEPFAGMAEAGIVTVFTDLDALRDSNPLYAAPVRFYGSFLRRLWPLSRLLDRPLLASPFQPASEMFTLRQALRVLFFKANHRKLVITDGPGGDWRLLVSSLNLADASSAHGNAGIRVEGELAAEALLDELACVRWSAERTGSVIEAEPGAWREAVSRLAELAARRTRLETPEPGAATARWLTEGAIRATIIGMLEGASEQDTIRIALFYLSDRAVVRALKTATRHGADVRLILDPNKDAFGREKNGIPNRPVAAELVAFAARQSRARLTIRWAQTSGEQFHAKAMSVTGPAGATNRLLAGSANWTRRNLADINMEANLLVEGDDSAVNRFNQAFDELWENKGGLEGTRPYGDYARRGLTRFLHAWLYRFQEFTGLGTF